MQERGKEQEEKREEEIAEAGEIEGQWERIRLRRGRPWSDPWPGEVPPAKEQLACKPQL